MIRKLIERATQIDPDKIDFLLNPFGKRERDGNGVDLLDNTQKETLAEIKSKCAAYPGMQALWIEPIGFKYPNMSTSANFLAEVGLDEHGKQLFKKKE